MDGQVTKDEARSDGVISRRLVESDFQITQRKFEITDALEALLGARWKRVYVSCESLVFVTMLPSFFC